MSPHKPEGSVLNDRPVKRREIFGWAMFDFANSSYTTVVITAIYSPFFVRYIVPAEWTVRDSWWSVAVIASTLISLVLSPLVGAICDFSGQKKKYLVASSIVCALATAGLAFVGPGQVGLALALLIISNAAFMLSETFCGAFLPDISTEKNIGWISGLGWGVGYMGGLLSILLVTQLLVRAEPGTAEYLWQNRSAMLATGVFFLLAALPTFLLVRNRSVPRPGFEGAGLGRLVKAGIGELKQAFTATAGNRVLFQFLVAFMVYMAGLDAIIKFVGIYASEVVQLEGGQFAVLFLILQVSAAAGALGFGVLESRLGPKESVLLSLCMWIVGALAIYFMDSLAAATGQTLATTFFAIAVVAGAGLGATQSASRTIVGLLARPGQTAQAFGFWSMFARLAAILGAGFGFVGDAVGRQNAVLLLLGYFVVGGVLLMMVPLRGALRERQQGQVPAES
jgi:UMF1 family MFS transporter